MRRRQILALLGGAALASSSALRAAAAQAADKPARIGFVSGGDQAAAAGYLDALRDGLAAHGYAEPRTLTMELLFADYAPERIPALVAELERRRVGVIVTHGAATRSVVRSDRTIPAVYIFSADPVSADLAADLAHPGFNATGITLMMAELNGKRLELLREIAPQIRRVAVLANPSHPGEHLERAESEASARQLGTEISFFSTRDRGELDRALGALEASAPQALVLFPDALVVESRQHIIDFAMRRRMPVVSGWAVMAESGALCTYGPRQIETWRRTAYFVERILKGAKAAELPIEQPSALELVINLNSARTLGLAIPPTVLARADRVIE